MLIRRNILQSIEEFEMSKASQNIEWLNWTVVDFCSKTNYYSDNNYYYVENIFPTNIFEGGDEK